MLSIKVINPVQSGLVWQDTCLLQCVEYTAKIHKQLVPSYQCVWLVGVGDRGVNCWQPNQWEGFRATQSALLFV